MTAARNVDRDGTVTLGPRLAAAIAGLGVAVAVVLRRRRN